MNRARQALAASLRSADLNRRNRRLLFEQLEDRRVLTLPALTIGVASSVTEGTAMYIAISL